MTKTEKIRKVEIAIATAALVAFLAFLRPVGTGFLAETAVHSQNVNMVVDTSRELSLKSLTGGDVKLASLSLSGKVDGEGLVAVYLEDSILVYSNAKKSAGFGIITGLPVTTTHAPGGTAPVGKALFAVEENGEVPFNEAVRAEGQYTTDGVFSDTCIESCALPPDLEAQAYKLTVYVEPGTRFLLGRIRYITTP